MVPFPPFHRPGQSHLDSHTLDMWSVAQWSQPLFNLLSLCGLLVSTRPSRGHPLPPTPDASKPQQGPATIIPRKEPTNPISFAIPAATPHSYPTGCPITKLVMRHHSNVHHIAPSPRSQPTTYASQIVYPQKMDDLSARSTSGLAPHGHTTRAAGGRLSS
jgi:hypothetical protein